MTKPSLRGVAVGLSASVIIQSIAAVIFLWDAAGDILYDPASPESLFEGFTAVALILGAILGARYLRETLDRLHAQERALATARGSLADVISQQFEHWGLTAAEKDVGLFALKGLSADEIAELRHVSPGTVRAQLAHIYAKAGVAGRGQFAAWFVEDLLEQGIEEA